MVEMDLNAGCCWSHWPCCFSMIRTEGPEALMVMGWAVAIQSFHMKVGQLGVFRSPRARVTSASLPRGTHFIVSTSAEFLPAGFASFDGYGEPKLTDDRQNASIWRLCG